MRCLGGGKRSLVNGKLQKCDAWDKRKLLPLRLCVLAKRGEAWQTYILIKQEKNIEVGITHPTV